MSPPPPRPAPPAPTIPIPTPAASLPSHFSTTLPSHLPTTLSLENLSWRQSSFRSLVLSSQPLQSSHGSYSFPRNSPQQQLPCTLTPSTSRYSPQSQSQHSLPPSTPLTGLPPPSWLGLQSFQPSHSPSSATAAQLTVRCFSEDEGPPRIVRIPFLERPSQRTSSQPQQPPSPSTPIPSSTRIRQPSTAPYSLQSQHTLSPSAPLISHPPRTPSKTPWVNGSTTPRVDSFTLPDSFTPTSSALQPSPPIPMPSTRLPPTRTSTQVGGPPPSALEDPEVREMVLRAIAKLAYGILSLSAAMLNVNAFSSNPITKVPLVIATMAAFFAVVLHSLISLHLHVFESAHYINHIERPFMLLVAILALSVFATLFTLPAHSWSQAECNPYCWVERALVSTVVIGGLASLMIGGWRMRGPDWRLAVRVV